MSDLSHLENLTSEELLGLLDQQKKIVQEAQDRLDRDGYFIQTRYGSGPHPAIRVQREATMTMMAIQRAMRISNKQGDDRAGWDPLNDE